MRVLVLLIVLAGSVAASPGAAHADEASSHYHKALVHKRQGNLDRAIASLKQALALRDDYAAAHHSIGMLYRKRGKVDKALEHLREAARLESGSAEIHYSLALAWLAGKRVEQAIAAMRRAAELKPKDPEIQAGLGSLLIRKDPKQATVYLLKAVKAMPDDHQIVQQLGLAYRKAKNFKLAEKYLLRSAAIKETATTEFNLGVLYRRMEKPQKAVAHYEAALQLNPKMAAAHWDVAHMYTQLKRDEDAIRSYRAYLALKGKSRAAAIARKRIKELQKK